MSSLIFKVRWIWIEEMEKWKCISGSNLFLIFKMSIREEIRLNITIKWHNKPSKGRIFKFQRKNNYFHFVNILTRQLWITRYILLFQGLVNKFIVTQICHQVLRLSLRKGRISYWFFCLPLINYYLDFLRWNDNNNAFIIGAFTEAEIQVRINEPSPESYHWRKCNCKGRREVNFKRISL